MSICVRNILSSACKYRIQFQTAKLISPVVNVVQKTQNLVILLFSFSVGEDY